MDSQSKPRELKPEQATAAHTLDRHLSVTAGPGSGKTTVLVERYLEILRIQKVSVDNIVAITFTIRAANEMRERVRAQIDQLLRDAAGDERRKWLRHKRALEGAVITTIHGFCSRLLHEFPLEANIDPQFVLLDEHEAMMMVEAVVEGTLSDAIHHGNEQIVKLAQGVGGRGMLAAMLVDFYLKYRGSGSSLGEIQKRTAANHAAPAEYQNALAELDARAAQVLAVRVKTPAARRKYEQFAAAWPAFRAILAQPPTDKTIAGYTQAIEDFWESRPSRYKNDAVELMDEMIWGAKSTSDDRVAGKLPQLGVDLLARDYGLAVLKLMHETERRLEEEKQRLSVVDFDDLQLRALKLLHEHPEIMASLARRYRFFLVDEFQDTNGIQRDLMMRLGLLPGANLFIVGDRKQSIYGFRGADVDVFREMTAAIEREGGAQQPLHSNFRSQPPLIDALNFLFPGIFRPPAEVPPDDLDELGYVAHEPSVAERSPDDQRPLVEMLLSVLPDGGKPAGDQDDEAQSTPEKYDSRAAREHDAAQLVERINELVSSKRFNYGDIAILFRALTVAGTYEAAFRRAGIPYLTVQGKGFYQREEITDLIQLLRFLDNTTDEIALAAVLRSPLCGISDNALFALRSAPLVGETPSGQKLPRRRLWSAIKRHGEIQFIDEAEHAELERVAEFLSAMIARRNRYSIADLLRFAVNSTDFMAVIAANFDGPQRIANVEKLFRLAEIFERSGQLIRDFVHFVEEFEEVGGRESEGQMDKTANVVRLMTIHQAKGLEFPVVIIPEIHRYPSQRDGGPYVLDRHKGFTVSVPDGRGGSVRGALFRELRQRGAWREQFESMRVFYVAATRARDRLIFSAAVAQKDLKNLKETTREQWLAWLWQALELDEFPESGVLDFGEDIEVNLRVNHEPESVNIPMASTGQIASEAIDVSQPLEQLFPLIQPIAVERSHALRRFSVTQLINFQRCARQYYFDRLLHTPGEEELAAWNDAEIPEPPANLTATLKGAVIHRFCETFSAGDDPKARLRESFDYVRSQRQAELAGRVLDIDVELAVQDLLPLAEHYLASDVFRRVQVVQQLAGDQKLEPARAPQSSPGVWSELRFRLRRPLGVLTGTIDKLLIQPAANGDGFDVEIIDFKTNRFRQSRVAAKTSAAQASANIFSPSPPAEIGLGGEGAVRPTPTVNPSPRAGKGSIAAQASFDFETAPEPPINLEHGGADARLPVETSLEAQIQQTAHDYQLQMQSYALALRELLPADFKIASLRATLHFIDPNVESVLPDEFLTETVCVKAIDEAMQAIVALDGSLDAERFPPLPAAHCRICNFLELCPAGKEWLRRSR
jgi:ATP-dependent helicase/nuclease subunit A